MPNKGTIPRDEISRYFKRVQDDYCAALEKLDGSAKFQEDSWKRDGGGGGRTRVIQDGALIEKGGVNFSAVQGELPQNILNTLDVTSFPPGADYQFYATGISLVLHPVSPLVPIIHLNLRYFEVTDEADPASVTSWFGGGIDLTPHYVVEADAAYFHRALKDVCDMFNPSYYPDFKRWADEYFFIKHRNETRGLGGIFFDKLEGPGVFEFVQGVADIFIPTYQHLIEHNRSKPFGENELAWQAMRRGRYVEFNLVYDRGTKFGLETSGRAESILMSLPKHASWHYDHSPAPNSPEQHTLDLLKQGIDWAG